MDKDLLHHWVDNEYARLRGVGKNAHRLVNAWQVTVLHALIDLDFVTDLMCQAPHCRQPTTPVTAPVAGRRQLSTALELDHVIPIHLGGAYRLSNLRIVHLGCNRVHSPETKAKIKAGLQRAYDEGRR